MAKKKFKTEVVPSWTNGEFTVRFTIGVQTFTLNIERTKKDAQWYKRNLDSALMKLQTGKDL